MGKKIIVISYSQIQKQTKRFLEDLKRAGLKGAKAGKKCRLQLLKEIG